MRRRAQIQRGGKGGALKSRGGGRGFRSREGPTYLVGAVVIVLVSSGESGCWVIMELAEEGRKGGRKEGSAGQQWLLGASAVFLVGSSCVRLR
jgi:hypothetical protein